VTAKAVTPAAGGEPRENAMFDVDAVAFDLDGTLLDTVHDLAAAINALLIDEGLAPLPKATVRDLIGKGIENLIARAVALRRGEEPAQADMPRLLERYFGLYDQILGRDSAPFPGVVDGLAQLARGGIPLAVVTNKVSRFIRPHLERAAIDHHFHTLVGGDDLPQKKPHAAPLLAAAARMKVAPARMLMVGDSANDVAAARAAGCPVVVVPYGYREGIAVQALRGDGIVDLIVDVANGIAARRRTESLP